MTKRVRLFQYIVAVLLLGMSGAAVSYAQSLELLFGINYDPIPRGSGAESTIIGEQIEQDLDMIAEKFTTIRIYQSQGISEQIITIAAEKRINVVIQTWLTGNPDADAAEISQAIALASQNANVTGVIVGSEVLSRGDLTIDGLTEAIETVRAGIPENIPIGYADVFLQWIQNPTLAELVDWIGLDSYGFLDCQKIQGAIQYSINQWALLISNPAFSRKQIILMETGWPTEGANDECINQDQEFASAQTQAEFIGELINNAQAAQLDTFVFEFADSPWRCEDTDGASGASYSCHWGLVEEDRTPKDAWIALPAAVRPAPPIAIIGVIAADDLSSANCRVQPDLEADVHILIPDGEEVTILDRSSVPGWLQVQYEDDLCWVHHSLIWVDGLPLPATLPALDLNTTSLRQFLASADPFLCMGATPGELTNATWTAPDIETIASCVRNYDVWALDAGAQQSSLEQQGVCDIAPSTEETATQERFQNIWALDNMAIAYYNLGRGLRRVGEYQLALEAFRFITTDFSCAWAFDSTGAPYFWSVARESQEQIDSLPLATTDTSP